MCFVSLIFVEVKLKLFGSLVKRCGNQIKMFEKKSVMPAPNEALPGREEEISVPEYHFVNGNPMQAVTIENYEKAMFGLGCFWGAERIFWETPGVFVTAVGYAGGLTPNPTYEEVCSGLTGHNEVVRVFFDPAEVSFEKLLKKFWEGHNPTQGMRQGNDVGTQYRSGIYVFSRTQREIAERSSLSFEEKLSANGFSRITTEILDAPAFYFAEDYHQQYLAKVPNGYCGLGGTGIEF